MSFFARQGAPTPRGATLIEVLTASAILAIGASAIGTMLVQTSMAGRDTVRKLEANALGVSTAEEWASRGFMSLSPMADGVVRDAGTIVRGGVPIYSRTISVSPLSSLDAGTAYPGVVVRSQVTWSGTAFMTPQTASFQLVVTGPFDGG